MRRAMIQPILFLPMHKTSMLRFCGTHLPLLTARLPQCQTKEHNQSLSYSNEQRTESQNCWGEKILWSSPNSLLKQGQLEHDVVSTTQVLLSSEHLLKAPSCSVTQVLKWSMREYRSQYQSLWYTSFVVQLEARVANHSPSNLKMP